MTSLNQRAFKEVEEEKCIFMFTNIQKNEAAAMKLSLTRLVFNYVYYVTMCVSTLLISFIKN